MKIFMFILFQHPFCVTRSLVALKGLNYCWRDSTSSDKKFYWAKSLFVMEIKSWQNSFEKLFFVEALRSFYRLKSTLGTENNSHKSFKLALRILSQTRRFFRDKKVLFRKESFWILFWREIFSPNAALNINWIMKNL